MQTNQLYVELEKNYQQGQEHWGEDTRLTTEIISFLKTIPHKTILEIGCGKGFLTKELVKICTNVTAIDVSPTAIENATHMAPQATFVLTSFENFESTQKYDVIICSEVLYYMKDRTTALKKLKSNGKYLITSNFIIDSWNIGLGSIVYEILLRQFKLLKYTILFSKSPLEMGLKSLWQLS